MRKPNPHNSSFFFRTLYENAPYNLWLQFSNSPYELQTLKRIFCYTPKDWLEWVDSKISSSEKRGIIIHNQLHYRLSILRKGLINLQEAKYICDVLENALRQVVISHINSNEITYKQLKEYMPEWDRSNAIYKKSNKTIVLSNIVDANFILILNFYPLSEIISRKWIFFSKELNIPGFGIYFRLSKKCRDSNVFEKDMKIIRGFRNYIAHSKKLFSIDEVQKLYKLSSKWLLPIDIELSQKILSYRMQRPGFLQDLDILEN